MNKDTGKTYEMKLDDKKFWFPAKTYGWGWGPPKCWQGWLVMVVYALSLAAGAVYFLRSDRSVPFVLYVFAMTVMLLVVVWLKGEKPQWRWGRDK